MDGEGWIGMFARQKHPQSLRYYQGRLTIGMTAPALPLLQEFQAQWGGHTVLARKATDRWAAAWAWSLFGKNVTPFLGDLIPHLRIKQDVATVVLNFELRKAELPRHRNGSPIWTPELAAWAETVKETVHSLNSKGPAPSAEGI